MILCYKFKLKPTRMQHDILRAALEHSRQLYNAAIEERISCYRKTGRGRTYIDQCYALTELRRDGSPYAATMERAPLKAADLAFRSFFARGGFPRFKAFGRFKSIGWTDRSGWKYSEGRFWAKGLGSIKAHIHREMCGVLKTARIKREGRHWWVNLTCEVQSEVGGERPHIGIDLGINSLATLSDGTRIENRRPGRIRQAELRRSQRALARCRKGSARREKVRQRLAAVHAKIERTRNTYLHQISARLARSYAIIAVEGLQIKNMSRAAMNKRGLNRSINDAAWGRLKELLRYKAELHGGSMVEVDPRGTSQSCSGCGTMVRKALYMRWHDCPDCGLSIDRDHNAALNVLHRAVVGPGLAKPLIAAV